MDAAAPLPRNLGGSRPVRESLEGGLPAELPALRVTLRRLAAADPGLDADDLLQETVQRALRYRHAYDPAQPLGAWLHGIGLRVYLDARERSRRSPRPLGDTVESVATDAPGPRSGAPRNGRAPASDTLLAADLRRLLAALPDADRAALERFHLREQSVAEIARATGEPEGTVKSRLHRARQRLAALARREDWL